VASGDVQDFGDPDTILGRNEVDKLLANQVAGFATDQGTGGTRRVDHHGFAVELEQNVGPAEG
jgi:hypothetical protein